MKEIEVNDLEKEKSKDSQNNGQNFLGNLTFLHLGICTLIPWNVVISTLSFFEKSYPYQNVSFIISIPNIIASYIFGMFILIKSDSLSVNMKIQFSLVLSILFMMLTPIIAEVLQNTLGFILFMGIVFLSAGLTTILQACSMGIGGYLSQNNLTYFATGTGISGIVSSLLRVFQLLIFNEGINETIESNSKADNMNFWGELVYFSINIVFFLLAIAFFYKFQISSFYLSSMERYKAETKNEIQEKLLDKESVLDQNEETAQLSNNEAPNRSLKSIWGIFKISWVYQVLVVLITAQTFFLFPGIALSKKLKFLNSDWNNALLVLVYNCGDTCGKYLNLLIGDFSSKLKLVIFISWRFIFILPFFLMAKNYSFYLFQSSWFPFILMFLFAFTNGYGFTQILVKTPSLFTNNKQIELSEQILSFMFNVGSTIGTFTAYGIEV